MKKMLPFALALVAVAAQSHAADYPNRPIRLIIGQPPGGTTDLAGRIYAEKMREAIGQPVIVENRPGAGTQLGLQMTAQAAPDGYVLNYAGSSLSILPSVSKSWTLDSTKDLTPVSYIVRGVNGLGVQPSAPYKTLDEFLAYAKANPGKLNYANISSPDLFAFTMFKNAAGIEFTTIRYNGATPAANAVMAGQADFYAATIGSITDGFVNSGKMRVLAVMTFDRTPLKPDMPSFGESSNAAVREASKFSGLGAFWFGLVGPGKLQRDVVTALYQATLKVSKDQDYVAKVRGLGLQSIASSPEDFAKLIVDETAKFREVAKQAGVEPQ
jgi:tripartite-type tricarboxylate transporter receptor subunit TctC